MAKLISALVLCDIVSHGLKAGTIVEAQPELIKALAADGGIDTCKEALIYARGQGAASARSAIELAAEQRTAAREAQLVAIAQAEQLLVAIAQAEQLLVDAKDKDDETKAALAKDLATKREALAALSA
jgi:hypothetical protein